jgi:hypothetical protein
MPPLITNILMIVISVIASGFVAWLLDRRKERRSHRKFEADRRAVIEFLRMLPFLRKDQQELNKFFEKLGDYRCGRISVALKKMKLCSFVAIRGGFVANLSYAFSSSSESEIEQMIQDVQKGIYDDTFESSP